MSKDKENSDRFIKRAQFEEQHHKVFDYKQKDKLCQECGEKNSLHTYTCIHYDRTAR